MGSGFRAAGRWVLAGLIAVAVIAATGAIPVAAGHWAPPPTVWVESTGHTADRLFLEAWRTQRPLFGDPITEEFRARAGFNADGAQVVQVFQNLALAYVPDDADGEVVQPLDLGRQALAARLTDRPSAALLRADKRTACGAGAADCLTIAETGQTLRGAFRAFWEQEGVGHWLGLPLTEVHRLPDGSMVQYFENGVLRKRAGQDVAPLPLGVQWAKRLALDTDPIPKPEDVPVFDEDLFVEPPEPEPADQVPAGTDLVPTSWAVGGFGPGPQQGAWKEIVVSISQQAMWAYENGELVISSYVSTGTAEVPETVTPIGSWSILTKYDVQDMEGTISNEYYFVEDVPDVMYFDNLGNALHGTYWHNNFGTPMSHGCVNLPLDVAAWLYDWAPVGTAVSVIG